MMNRRQWLEHTGIALVAGLAACKKAPAPAEKPVKSSAVKVGVNKDGPITIQTPSAEFHVLPSGHVQAFLRKGGEHKTLDDPENGIAGGYLVVDGKPIADFKFDFGRSIIAEARGKTGLAGKHIEIPASSPAGIEKTLAVEVYDDFPNLAVVTETYKNISGKEIRLDQIVANRHRVNASLADPGVEPYRLWSFQGSSYKWGENIIEEISPHFSQPNWMGGPTPTPQGMGGGIPVVAFWTDQVGIAIGHIELLPLVLSFPVKVGTDQRIDASMQIEPKTTLKQGESYSLPRSFIAVYEGDFYKPLRLWSEALEREGWDIPKPQKSAYAIDWCGWGYEQDVTRAQMLGTIPKLKELNIRWTTLDYRWFNDFGDWEPRQDTFPGDTIKQLADEFHKRGFYITLWWQPLGVDDGQGKHLSWKHAVTSKLAQEHPDWLILDKNGKHARLVSPVCDVAALCPALPEVRQYFKSLVERFMGDWGFDGNKLDSVFSAPPCFNPKHHHQSPQDSIKAMPEVLEVIFETTRALKPESVTQICPCGAPPNFAWLPYMNQAVTADPVGSVQVRRRIKMYKALLGPQAAVYGDHVELTKVEFANSNNEVDVGEDFASTVGTGGVIGTKFVWPDPGPHFKTVYLTPEKEQIWKKWTTIYNSKMLSEGTFLDLYNYGYDFPEGYAIRKGDKMYYAFYASHPLASWHGEIELRGLAAGKYQAFDYEHDKGLGTVDGQNARLKTGFTDHLLLEVSKI